MGPRSDDRGIGSGEDVVWRREVLQWGRDLMIAEFTGSGGGAIQVNMLQWGRDLMIAELCPLPPAGKTICSCFNGAAI